MKNKSRVTFTSNLDGFRKAIEKKALDHGRSVVTQTIEGIRCPVHGLHPKLRSHQYVDRATFDSHFEVCCDKLRQAIKHKLAELPR